MSTHFIDNEVLYGIFPLGNSSGRSLAWSSPRIPSTSLPMTVYIPPSKWTGKSIGQNSQKPITMLDSIFTQLTPRNLPKRISRMASFFYTLNSLTKVPNLEGEQWLSTSCNAQSYLSQLKVIYLSCLNHIYCKSTVHNTVYITLALSFNIPLGLLNSPRVISFSIQFCNYQ